MSITIDDLVLQIQLNDEAKAERTRLTRELRELNKELEAVRKEQGADSAAARELEEQYRALRVEQGQVIKRQEQSVAATRKSRRELADQEKQVNNLRQSWSKFGNLLRSPMFATVSMAGLIYGSSRLIKNYADASALNNQLTVSLAKFPGAAKASEASYAALNRQIMLLTGADDDALAAGEGTLAMFGLQAKEIQALIPLVNDLAIKKGTDVVAASEAVGKALMGNARLLKSIGVDYKSTGDRAKDTAALIKILEQQVGGTGKAFGAEASGDLARFQKVTENIRESLGEGLAPIMKPLTTLAIGLMNALEGIPAPLRTGVSVVVLMTGALVALVPQIMQAVTAWGLLRISQDQTAASSGRLRATLGSAAGFLGGPWGIALTAGTFALFHFVTQAAEAEARVKSFAEQIDATTGKLNQAGIVELMKQLQTDISAADWQFLDKFGLGLDEATRAAVEGGPALEEYRSRIEALRDDSAKNTWMGVWFGDSYVARTAQNNVEALSTEVTDAQQRWRDAGSVAKSLGIDIGGIGDEATDAANELTPLTRELNRVGHALNLKRAVRDWQTSVREATKSPTGDNAGAALQQFLSTAGTYKEGGKAQAKFVTENYDQMRAIIENAGLKESTKKAFLEPLLAAKRAADEVLASLEKLSGRTFPVNVAFATASKIKQLDGHRDGGFIRGIGTGTSDSNVIRASKNEYMIRAYASQSIGSDALHGLNQWDRLTPAKRSAVVDKLTSTARLPRVEYAGHRNRIAPSNHIERHYHVHAERGVDVRAELAAYERMNHNEQQAALELVP